LGGRNWTERFSEGRHGNVGSNIKSDLAHA
jgi:hypothetical protein